MRHTKKEIIETLVPIELAPIVTEEILNKQSKRWTVKGLEKLREFWHKYYTDDAHNLIGTIVILYGENSYNLDTIETKLLKKRG